MNEPTIFASAGRTKSGDPLRVAIPAIIGLVQVGKDLGLPTRAAPALSVALGILASLAQIAAARWPWVQAATIGVALGLSACGLYAGARTVLAPRPTGASSQAPLREAGRHPEGTRGTP